MSRLAARDIRSNLGSNLNHIRRESGLDPWLFGASRIGEELCRFHEAEIPVNDEWRLVYLDKLLCKRLIAHYNGLKDDEEELSKIISSLVSS